MKADARQSPGHVCETYGQFSGWIEQQDLLKGKSSMWKNLINDFDLGRNLEEGREKLFRPTGFRAYNFFYAKYETVGFVLKRFLLVVAFWVSRAMNFARGSVWQINVAGGGAPQLSFHPAGLRLLRNLGLYKGYRSFCDNFKFSLHCANGIKSYYCASNILPYLKTRSNPRVIEIGGGMGTFASVVHFSNPIFQYVIVDLPEMLLHSSLTLHTCFPNMACYFLFPGSKDTYQADRPGFYFCVPDCVDQLTPETFDLGCNIDSFQEMTEEQVAGYLRLMQCVLREGGYLMNLNRRKFLEVERFDNNPLLYSYDFANKILTWEIDQFMDRVLNYDHIRRDGWLLRVEQIQKVSMS